MTRVTVCGHEVEGDDEHGGIGDGFVRVREEELQHGHAEEPDVAEGGSEHGGAVCPARDGAAYGGVKCGLVRAGVAVDEPVRDEGGGELRVVEPAAEDEPHHKEHERLPREGHREHYGEIDGKLRGVAHFEE